MTVFRTDGITIHVSIDEMTALLSISVRGDDFPSLAVVESALQEAEVVVGVNTGILKKLVSDRKSIHELNIAQGLAASDPIPDELVWKIDIATKHRPNISVDGKADFKQLKQFEVVSKGDQIVKLVPGVPGQPKTTVTGKIIEGPANIEPLVIPAGKNTQLSKNGLTLCAAIDGVAMLKRGKVVVDNVFHIHGDVDFNTGNVKYQGTVMIGGDVRSGFRVEATDSIIIKGSVEAAEIYSKNGSIVIENGVLGRGRARILAGDDLICGFIQDVTASIKNDVVIKHYAINSHITSGGKILLNENEGLIRGGKTIAEKGIELLEAGSDQNILTEMALTRSDMDGEQSKLWQSKIDLAEEYRYLDSLKKRLEFLELLQQRLNTISEERAAEIAKIHGEITAAENQIEMTTEKCEKLVKEAMGQSPEYAVKIKKCLHPKVTVTIGHKKYYSTSIKGGVCIYRQGDEMLVESLN
ncbi:MAG: FapA family protein [Candidatus Marinimicrobia bacterium]|nr:FapA family protein [Candidatus Neomarinimicrobiota bacterium]